MNTNIENLNPQSMWKHFKNICNIPHPSGHTKELAENIVAFAKKNNIDCTVDKIGNVILRKPATPGYENRKGLILQAHMDMVPQKNGDKNFDFTKDAIEAYIDGDWVTANGTTLGADDGLGVAAILAIFENKDLKHGDLEALITMDEETGMYGAFAVEKDSLKGEVLINLDSETEGDIYVGCAGGIDLIGKVAYKKEDAPANFKAIEIDIKNLKGGHSGMEIILQRGNSNKVLFRVLNALNNKFNIHVAEASGGNMRNAIPREANGLILVAEKDVQNVIAEANAEIAKIKDELKAVEPEMNITVSESSKTPSKVMDKESQNKLIWTIEAVFNGTDRMSDDMEGLVETSSNMGIIIQNEDHFEINFLIRSSVDSAKDELAERMSSVFRLAGAEYSLEGGYHGWKPNMESPILKSTLEMYNELFGKTPEIRGIHAGLECGILGGIFPNWDMISFGPTICYPHSPDEKVEIKSTERFFKLIEAVIENAPIK